MSEPRRWVLEPYKGMSNQPSVQSGPDVSAPEMVMPVSEHESDVQRLENSVVVKRQAFEVAEGGRKIWMKRCKAADADLGWSRKTLEQIKAFAEEALDAGTEEAEEHGEAWDENCDMLISARHVLKMANLALNRGTQG